MFKNYFERRKALQNSFKEKTEGRFPDEPIALKIHRELTFPARVLLIAVCILVIIYACKC